MGIKGKINTNINIDEPEKIKIGIVQALWNQKITDQMVEECRQALMEHSIPPSNILHKTVPGSFELPLGAVFVEQTIHPDAIVCLGCVIKGDTDHDVFINQGITTAIMDLNLQYGKPFVFGVLTVNTPEQAIERSGGIKGNKGRESAEAALEMVTLKQTLKRETNQTIGFKPQSQT